MRIVRKIKKLLHILTMVDRTWLRALRLGVPAGVEHVTILRRLTCRTVLDVGANRGQFALAAKRCFPDAQVLSFEPLVEPATKFRATFCRDSSVTLYEAAIGPQSGNATIHISRRDDSSSLLPITAQQGKLFPGTQESGTRIIRVAPLRDLIEPECLVSPVLLKLDVQGFELQALAGCEDLLGRVAFVYVECSFVELYSGQAFADEVIRYLQGRGFTLDGIYNLTYDRDGRVIQGDFLFVRRPIVD